MANYATRQARKAQRIADQALAERPPVRPRPQGLTIVDVSAARAFRQKPGTWYAIQSGAEIVAVACVISPVPFDEGGGADPWPVPADVADLVRVAFRDARRGVERPDPHPADDR